MCKTKPVTINFQAKLKPEVVEYFQERIRELNREIKKSIDSQCTFTKPEYQIIDEDSQKGYPPFVIKAVLIDKIELTYDVHKLAELVSVLFDTEPDIVRWTDDDELGLALPKDDDEIQKHLAGMAISKL